VGTPGLITIQEGMFYVKEKLLIFSLVRALPFYWDKIGLAQALPVNVKLCNRACLF
jgi:hypothetical protein